MGIIKTIIEKELDAMINMMLDNYFESLLEQHGICYGYKFGPRMMNIQVEYNKNYHRKVNWML